MINTVTAIKSVENLTRIISWILPGLSCNTRVTARDREDMLNDQVESKDQSESLYVGYREDLPSLSPMEYFWFCDLSLKQILFSRSTWIFPTWTTPRRTICTSRRMGETSPRITSGPGLLWRRWRTSSRGDTWRPATPAPGGKESS